MKKEKELIQKPPVDKKTKPEQNFEIKITITDGEKKIKSKINVSDYKTSKELHNVSLVDETVVALLSQFENKEI
jgi:hypothetical protein